MKPFCPILQYQHTLYHVVERLKFGIWAIFIRLAIDGSAGFYNNGLDILAHHLSECAIVEITVVSIKEQYLIFDRGGAAYVGELVNEF